MQAPSKTYIQMYSKMKDKYIYYLYGKRLRLYAYILDQYPELVDYIVSYRLRYANAKLKNFTYKQFLDLEMGLMFNIVNSCYGKDGVNVIDYLKQKKSGIIN